MNKQLLAGAMAFALATGMTTGASAFGRGSGSFHSGFSGFHSSSFSGFRSAGTVGSFRNSFAAMPAARFSGVRGFNTAVRPGSWGMNRGWTGRRFVGSGWSWNRGWAGRRFVGGGWGGGWDGWSWDPGVDVGLGLLGFGLGVAALSYPYCSPYDYGYYDYGYCGYPGYSTYVGF